MAIVKGELVKKINDTSVQLYPTTSADNVVYDSNNTVADKLNAIETTLTFDSSPTENSDNPVKSGGVYTALAGKADATAMQTALDRALIEVQSVRNEVNSTIAVYLDAIAAKDDGAFRPTSWAGVQSLVRNGLASKVFAIGDQLICQRGNNTLVWDIIGIDHDTPADPQFTHSMTLQLHDCFPTAMQFDAPEAFYYCETALEAGTYHFTVDSTDYQFTLESDIAAGSQLILNFTGGAPSTITVSATKGGAVSEGSVTVTAGSDGSELMGVNDITRARYGSNNYKESAIRQWLNSSAAAGSVWTPQTDFDRPPSWAASTAGFLNGMDADFLAAIGKTHIVVVRNIATDGGGSDEMDDYFFFLSRSEVYSGVEASGVNEGAAYPYYADYSDLTVAGISVDSNRIKYGAGTAQCWWLRSPFVGGARYVRYVGVTGNVDGTGASSGRWVAPACNII